MIKATAGGYARGPSAELIGGRQVTGLLEDGADRTAAAFPDTMNTLDSVVTRHVGEPTYCSPFNPDLHA